MIVYKEDSKEIIIPTGLGNLAGLMESEAETMYNSGRTDGYAEGVAAGMSIQDRKLTDSVTFNENSEYDADYGYKKVIVDVDNQWDEGYESGFTDGIVSANTIDAVMGLKLDNPLMSLHYGRDLMINDVPYDCNYFYVFEDHVHEVHLTMDRNTIITNIKFSADIGGNDSGMVPTTIFIWFNEVPVTVTNLSYEYTESSDHGWFYAVRYNIDTEPLTIGCPECDCSSAITDAYESGYTDGYASGYTNGYASGYTDGQSGYELGTYVSTPMPNDLYGTIYTKSFNDESHSPEIVGWGALHLDLAQIIYYGKNEQKALMTSGTIISNGTYTMEDGWNKIVVDVPQGESKGALYSIFVSFAGHPALSSLPTDWKVNGFDFTVTSGYTNILTNTLIGVEGNLNSAVSLITPNVITFKVPTEDYEQWSEYVSADSCKVNGVINYQTSAYDGGFLQHITGWVGTPDADDLSKTIITINIGQ